jgi:site-specific DNA-methyltransferase (adenine-specific)/modification methylase
MTEPRREVLAYGVEVWLGDMLSILPTLGAFDACVTDPPYGIGENDRKVASRGKLAAPKDYGAFDWDSEPASNDSISAIRACSRHQIIFGGNYFDMPPSSCWLVWDKQNGDNDFADCELAWTNLRQAVRRIYWRWNGMIRKGQEDREHPTQKPLGVMLWCLDQLPADVHTIVDPFAGSGTTGVAAVKRGKHFTGIEREPRYFDIARRRISDALARPDLFIEPPKPAAKQEALDI